MDAQQFLAEFGHIANAPGGVQSLRGMIYNLAINGDLVSSYPSNEAMEILQVIKWLKKNHEESKKVVSGQKEVSATEILVPKNWVKCRLGDLVLTITGGGTPSKSNPLYWNGDIPWASVKDLGNKKFLSSTLDKITSDGLINSSSNLIPENRVIICTRMGLGKIAINTIPIAINQDLKALELPPEVNIHFFFILYKTRPIIGKGTTVSGIRQNNLLEIPAVIPALEEQKCIVAKVDELMKLCDKLEAQQQKRNKLKKLTCTTLLNALANAQSPYKLKIAWQRVQEALPLLYTDPEDVWLIKQTIIDLAMSGYLIENSEKSKNTGSALLDDIEQSRLAWETESKDQELKEAQAMRKKLKKQKYDIPKRLLPENWAWGSFLQISQTVVDCHNKTAPYVLKGVHLIRTTDIRNGKMDLRNTKKITEETYEYWARRMPPKEGDIFFTREAPMGEAAIVPSGDKVCLGQRTLLIRLFPEYFDNEFLLYAIYSPSFIARMEGMGIGATVKHLRVGDVEALIVPVPPIDEQRIIVKKLKQLLSVCDALEKKLVMERRVSKILAQASIATLTETGQSRKDELQNMEIA